jgi:hypothetical protein
VLNCVRMCAFLCVFGASVNLLGCAGTVDGGFTMEPGSEAHLQLRGSRVTMMVQNAGPGDVEVRIVSGGGEHKESMTLRPTEAVHRDCPHRLDAFVHNNSNEWTTIEYRSRAEDGVEVRYDGRVVKDAEYSQDRRFAFPKGEEASKGDS